MGEKYNLIWLQIPEVLSNLVHLGLMIPDLMV